MPREGPAIVSLTVVLLLLLQALTEKLCFTTLFGNSKLSLLRTQFEVSLIQRPRESRITLGDALAVVYFHVVLIELTLISTTFKFLKLVVAGLAFN